ncbi:hypothetical protein HF329_26195 [Chitinophaga oryzae]|uniref:Uncharacterized protein n=1 Tax=Chitinophaga oryzae TaxID=2725414 RepID=A0AAE6ZKA7_9BACT|nr:hypothetical protein [Chitinophaga oryzae]QJB34601.1 hypothetical protein HF329_26195 [Chitinophaga oryzae]
MKRLLLLLWLLVPVISAMGQGHDFVLNEIRENTTARKIGSLLIISAGPMSTRKIGQDMKYALDKQFRNKSFQTSIVHLGTLEYCTDENIAKASAMFPHDVVLVVVPKEVEDHAVTKNPNKPLTRAASLVLLGPLLAPNRYSRKEFANQLETFYLLDKSNLQEPFWIGQSNVSTNLDSNKYFDYLIKNLLRIWKDEGISVGG